MTSTDDLTVYEIDLMKHCIGFDDNKVTGIKHRVMHSYRNFFYDDINDEWERIKESGLASRTNANAEGHVYYRLTQEGFDFLARLCGFEKIVKTR